MPDETGKQLSLQMSELILASGLAENPEVVLHAIGGTLGVYAANTNMPITSIQVAVQMALSMVYTVQQQNAGTLAATPVAGNA